MEEQVQPEPVSQETAQPQETAPEAPEVTQEQPQTEVAPEQVSEVTETPVQEVSTEVEEDIDDIDMSPMPAPQTELQQVDWNTLPRDPNNPDYVDPNAFAQALHEQQQQAIATASAAARAEVQEQLREQKLWQQAEKAYPELSSNREMRDMIKNARLGEMASSLGKKNPTPKQTADRLFKQVQEARKQGVEQAQNNVRVQQSATLETASTTAPTDNKANLQQAVLSARSVEERSDANRALLRQMMDEGTIKVNEE